ncbi:MAG: PEP/pyruvate-binding domain-containing protein [Propionibacteriaceae bacterium]
MGDIRWFDAIGAGDVGLVGGKAANLGELVAAGLPVPPGFVITTDAYRRHAHETGVDVPEPLATEILAAYAQLGPAGSDGAVPVAVRSSATVEDLAEASFAGQQESYLNVRGSADLLRAVRQCWASLFTERAVSYRARQQVDEAGVALAVVVQSMVEADAAGVMFTANPANGRRDQLAINAAWGLGEAVVSGVVDADDLVVDAEPLAVRSRRTADKAVQVRYADHRTEEVPVPADRRRVAVLDDTAALELARLGLAAQEHFAAPQDIEWVRAADGFALVQSRPITALRPPEADPPTDWTVPHPTDLYVRASIVEQLPDPLSPLFAELADPSVSRSLQALMTELVGPGAVRPGDVGLPTVNGYAYYDYTRSGLLRITVRAAVRALPVLRAAGPRGGVDRWRDRAHPAYVATTTRWTARDPAELADPELFDGVLELLDAGTSYYTAVQTIIPLAALTELSFTAVYQRLVRRRGDPPATVFLLGGDSAPIRAEQSLWDLGGWVQELSALAGWLIEHDAAAILSQGAEAPEGVEAGAWVEWRRRFQAHLDAYGHTVYNLDFLHPTAAEEPAPLLDALRFTLRGQTGDPYERQRRSVRQREQAAAEVVARLDPIRRSLFRRTLASAQAVGPLREDALADVGLAWPRLRRLVLELGRRVVAAGAIEEPADVFWLRRGEIETVLADVANEDLTDLRDLVADRQMTWRGQRRVNPPQLLPRGGWIEAMRRWMPAASEDQTGEVITGISGSGGRVTGTARVLSGPQDFDQLHPGDILVATITTPAWTTLFTIAGGVVTDIGGPLSHSSIVAREYGIPAVLGTGAATRWAHSGEQLTVDGDAGTVSRSLRPSAPAGRPGKRPQPRGR